MYVSQWLLLGYWLKRLMKIKLKADMHWTADSNWCKS